MTAATKKRATKAVPAWRAAACSTLDTLSELLVAAYDVLEHTPEFDPVLQPMQEAARVVYEMRERDDEITRDDFGALLNTVRLLVEGAIDKAAQLRVHAWHAIAREVLFVLRDAEPKQPRDLDREFERGRDLFIQLATAVEDAPDNSLFEVQRRHRDGRPQDRIVKPYLLQLAADLTMLEGFAAALTGYIGPDDQISAASLRQAVAEYQAGEVGADGTKPYDDDAQPSEPPAPPEAEAALAECAAGADADAERRAALVAESQAEGLRALTRKSLTEISRLAEAVPVVLDANYLGMEDAITSMMSRVKVLSDVAYYASGFSVGVEAPSYVELGRAFEGILR